MGQCGCGDYQGDFKFKGSDDFTYVLQVYASCDYCDTPAGVIIYRMSPEDCSMWDVDHLKEVEISDIGTCVAVIHPHELEKEINETIESLEGVESDFHYAFQRCVYKAIKDNRKQLI